MFTVRGDYERSYVAGKQAQCPYFFSEATFSYSIYEPTTVDGDRGLCVCLTVGQSNSVHGLSTDLDSEDAHTNHRFHCWQLIIVGARQS